MSAYAAGDRRAFERLFARVAARVHGFFLRSFRDSAVSDDLMQVTFLKLHNARAQYQRALPFRPWLFTIAARVRLDELRRRYRLPEQADEEVLCKAEEAQAVADDAPGEQGRAEVQEEVRRALERLPESQRIVVHLHRYEGMTFPEIARVLSTTEGAIKLRAFRAYETPRESLKSLAGKGGDA